MASASYLIESMIALDEQANSIRKRIERHYSYESLGWFTSGYLNCELTVGLRSWGNSATEKPTFGASIYGHSNNQIGDLSARQLRQIAAIKQLFEDWLDGKIEDVPTELPASIREMP